MARRQHLSLILVTLAVFLCISFFLAFRGAPGSDSSSSYTQPHIAVTDSLLHGTATAPKLENATLKAELGNAGWKLLHTTMAKFPDKPTEEDSSSLKSFIYLFARLYPCGDCARHFQELLKKYPPQVGSRSSAATWACHVHNEVNTRLEKPLFDCAKIGDFYDCGCADDEEMDKKSGGSGKDSFTPLELEKNGLTRGG